MACQFHSVYHTAPVTALRFLGPEILTAGIGSSLHFYNVKTYGLLLSCETLPGRNIHGIRHTDNADYKKKNISCCFGEKSIRIWRYHQASNSLQFLSEPWESEDWIWDVCWLVDQDYDTLALALGHNKVLLWNWKTSTVLHRIGCEETCIIYCAHFIGDKWSSLILAAGTVFNQVVVWAIQGQTTDTGQQEVLHRLKGHKGVIFGIDYNKELQRLCSVSDDRSIRVWQLSPPESSIVSPGTVFTLLHVLFGHSARVWSGRLLVDRLVSVGEDSTCCVWDHHGNVMQKFKGHKGKSIWSLAVDENEDFVATGGGDHSVRLWRLIADSDTQRDIPRRTLTPPEIKATDFPRTVTLRDFNHVLVMTNEGCLYELSLLEDRWQTLHEDSEFRSYTVLSVSPDCRVIALGSIQGTLRLIVMPNSDSKGDLVCVNRAVYDGRLFSIIWLNNDTLLTIGPDGLMTISTLTYKDSGWCLESLRTQLILPVCKQRWVTSACLIPDSPQLVCGDRAGNVLLYQLTESIGHVGELKKPIQVLPKIHGKAGTTYVGYHGDHVYTCGRDGQYREYTVEDRLVCRHEIRAFKGFDWLDRLVFTGDDLLLVGFHSCNFIVWSKNRNQTLVEIECGGGHRTWQCQRSDNGTLRFVFLKLNDVILCESQMSSNQIILKGCLHGREICDVRHLISTNSTGETVDVFLTCSEDTNISINSLHSNQPSRLSVLQTLKGHISSVRTMSLAEIQESGRKRVVLFSAGGRAQIKVWRIVVKENESDISLLAAENPGHSTALNMQKISYDDMKSCKNVLEEYEPFVINYELLASHMLFDPKKRRSKAWRQQVNSFPPETRYMDLTVFCGDLLDRSLSNVIFVAAACSDALIRLFSFDLHTSEFSCVATSSFHDHCVLTIGHFVHHHLNTGRKSVVLYSGATDGRVAFWDATNIILDLCKTQEKASDASENCNITAQPDKQKLISQKSLTSDLGPPVLYLTNHQSGINSSDVYQCSDGDMLLVTGGDDNAVCLRTFTVTETSVGSIQITTNLRYDIPSAHSAQVTGAKILNENMLLTASIDQRVCLWRISLDKQALEVTLMGCKFVNVSDVSSIDVWRLRNEDGYGVVVTGEGLQILHVYTSEVTQMMEPVT